MQQESKILLQIIIISGFLSIIPMPDAIKNFEPFWSLLFFSYWLLYVDDHASYRYALILGFFIDILQFNILGQSALALVLSTFIILNFKKSFHISNKFSKQIYILLVAIIYLLMMMLVNFINTGYDFNYLIIFSPLTTAIFWPIVYFFMKSINKNFKK